MTCSNFGIININWIFNRSEDKMEEGIVFRTEVGGYNMQNVVLDALIPREDFEIASDIGNRGNTRNKTT